MAELPLSSTEIRILSKLLERTLALPPQDREAFVAALPAAQQKLVPRLRERLAQLAQPGDDAPAVPAFKPPPPRPASRQGERVGPYRLLRPLGQPPAEGGEGLLWQAERVSGSTRLTVALLLSPEDGGAGERQVVMLPEHPHVVRLQDAGVDERGRFYRAMAWIEGSTLLEHATRRGLAPAQRAGLLVPLCGALSAAHAGELAHGDLRPGNLRVDEEGRVRLLDWGRGRTLTPAAEAAEVRTLAQLLQTLLAGARGAPGPDLAAVLRSALREPGAPPYESLEALADDLLRVLAHRPVAVAPAGALHRARLFVRRNRVPLAAAVLGSVVLVAGVGWALQQVQRGRSETDRAAQARAFLAQALPPELAASGADPTLLLPWVQRTLDQARTGFAAEPVLRGQVIAELGVRFRELGQPEQALAVLREALQLLKGTAHDGDPALHAAQAQLAVQLMQSGGAGAADEARGLARQALAGCTGSDAACVQARALADGVLKGAAR